MIERDEMDRPVLILECLGNFYRLIVNPFASGTMEEQEERLARAEHELELIAWSETDQIEL